MSFVHNGHSGVSWRIECAVASGQGAQQTEVFTPSGSHGTNGGTAVGTQQCGLAPKIRF